MGKRRLTFLNISSEGTNLLYLPIWGSKLDYANLYLSMFSLTFFNFILCFEFAHFFTFKRKKKYFSNGEKKEVNLAEYYVLYNKARIKGFLEAEQIKIRGKINRICLESKNKYNLMLSLSTCDVWRHDKSSPHSQF